MYGTKEMDDLYHIIDLTFLLAFEAGKWAGQVELEEHYDRHQYGACMVEAVYTKNHTKPLFPASNGRDVTIQLRSDKWRQEVINSSNNSFEKAKDTLKKYIENYGNTIKNERPDKRVELIKENDLQTTQQK